MRLLATGVDLVPQNCPKSRPGEDLSSVEADELAADLGVGHFGREVHFVDTGALGPSHVGERLAGVAGVSQLGEQRSPIEQRVADLLALPAKLKALVRAPLPLWPNCPAGRAAVRRSMPMLRWLSTASRQKVSSTMTMSGLGNNRPREAADRRVP